MIINNFSQDIRELCSGSIAEAARSAGIMPKSAYKYIESAGVTKKFVELCDALGYDIKVEYIRKDGADPWAEKEAALLKREKDLRERLSNYKRRLDRLEDDMFSLQDKKMSKEAREIVDKWAIVDEASPGDDEEWM